MKLILKLLVLPVILILKIFLLAVNILVRLSSFVLSPLVLFITGCLIYCLFKKRWTDVALLTGMDAVVFLALFAAGWVTCIAEETFTGLVSFWYS